MTSVVSLVLDSEGLSAWIDEHRKVGAIIDSAQRNNTDLVVCATTIIEVTHGRTPMPRLNWLLSRVKVEPVTEQTARAAALLLKDTGLHGHKYAIDATVAVTALAQPGPGAILTSDADDMGKLCGPRIRVIPL
ncbi:PIN domain-containing protein [Streptomyces sp. NPDC054884]|uniref:PIN domain-containing protein n=1 Tax=Streptomyces sp. ME08-AFT2 TaxID=3028683 RepID=UPI0029A6DAF0|nr:PIN domain-containing protein [Streptomyces sp. ME08-AFT2]MDX3311110.1 PIN domain-containing protein [Streptomyces sp. ME08-AFT2]